jgi:hypothetical protein
VDYPDKIVIEYLYARICLELINLLKTYEFITLHRRHVDTNSAYYNHEQADDPSAMSVKFQI